LEKRNPGWNPVPGEPAPPLVPSPSQPTKAS
jgi:hypothetical protein